MKIASFIFAAATLFVAANTSADEIETQRWGGRDAYQCSDAGWTQANRSTGYDCVALYRNDDNRFSRDIQEYGFQNCSIKRDGSGDHFYYCNLNRGGGWGGGGGGGWGGRYARQCSDAGWTQANYRTGYDCVATYRNDDYRFNEDVRRYGFQNCWIARDSSGDRFYYCNLGGGWGGGGGGGGGGGYARYCSDAGWTQANYRTGKDCVAPYRNNDNRFSRDIRRYGFQNCVVQRDGSGDRFYYCDLP